MAFGILGWARRFYSAEDRRPDGRHFSGKNHFHLCRLSAEQRMQPLTSCGQTQHGETLRYEGGERRDIAIAKKNLRHEAVSVRTGSTPNKRNYCQKKALEGLVWEVRKSSGMGVVTQRNHLNNGSGAAPFHHRFSFFHLPLDQEPTKKFEPHEEQIDFFTSAVHSKLRKLLSESSESTKLSLEKIRLKGSSPEPRLGWP